MRDFGVDKTSGLTDISGLENISDTTKGAIKYMYLNNNNLTDNGGLSALSKFTGLQYLTVANNSNLTNLNGLENLNLINFYAQNCNLLNIEGLRGNSSLKIVSIKNNSNLTSLAGIEYENNCTSLTGLRAANCKLSDISALENSQIEYLSLSNQKNNALVNISSLQNCKKIKYLYLSGNTAILESDVVLNKNIFLACGTNYSLDKKYALVFLEQPKCDLSNYNLSSEEFSLLTNNESILELNLNGNDKLTNEDIENVLRTCTKIKKLTIDNPNLATINFIKSMPELWYLDIRGCSSLSDLSVLENLAKEKKLEIAELYIDNDNIKLKNIQTAMNEIYSRYWYGTKNGIKLGTASLVKQLEDCTNLTSIATYGDGNATNIDLNLSNLTNLTQVNVCSVRWNMKFPKSLKLYKADGGNGMVDFSLCENLSEISLSYNSQSEEEIESIFSTIINNKNKELSIIFSQMHFFSNTILDLTNLKSSNIKQISFKDSGNLNKIITTVDIPNLQSITINNCTDVDTIELNTLTNLRTISISNSNINSLDGIRYINALKEVNIKNSNIGALGDLKMLKNIENLNFSLNKIADINSLSALDNLVTLNLSNNNISDLTPLNNLINLQNLDISNNVLENYYFSFNNIDVLKNLNKNKLTQLNISGNSFSDTSELKKLKWNSYTE